MEKTVVVKGQVVGEYKYDNKNIENLILEEGMLYIGRCAFRHNNLKKCYQTKLEKSKPQFNIENNSSLTIEDTSPKALRNNLIFSLEIIIQNLNNKRKIISLSEKINQY